MIAISLWYSAGWCELGDAGVPAVFLGYGSQRRESDRLLNFCEQDYHKLLEFFFSDSVPPNSVLFSGGRPNQLRWSLVFSAYNKHALVAREGLCCPWFHSGMPAALSLDGEAATTSLTFKG